MSWVLIGGIVQFCNMSWLMSGDILQFCFALPKQIFKKKKKLNLIRRSMISTTNCIWLAETLSEYLQSALVRKVYQITINSYPILTQKHQRAPLSINLRQISDMVHSIFKKDLIGTCIQMMNTFVNLTHIVLRVLKFWPGICYIMILITYIVLHRRRHKHLEILESFLWMLESTEFWDHEKQ